MSEVQEPKETEALVASEESQPEWSKRASLYSTLGGLCPLIPIPFVDDIVMRAIRRRYLGGMFEKQGLALSGDQLDVVARMPDSGCFLGCVYTVLIYPIRKIFRKVFFFLSIKDSIDIASRLFHRGILVHRAIEDGILNETALSKGDLQAVTRVQSAIEVTLDEIDTRPINQMLRKVFADSRHWMRKAAGGIWRGARAERKKIGNDAAVGKAVDSLEGAEGQKLDSLAEELSQAIWAQKGYVEALEGRFLKTLASLGSEDPNTTGPTDDP
jgi:hypothetical protein